MTKTNKTKPKAKSTKKVAKPNMIKELATQFEEEFKTSLPISVQPDGSVVYKEYLIKETPNRNWGIYSIYSRDLIEEFFLKTCALMAAKAYNGVHIEKFFEIKRLDTYYWANYCDTLVYKKNIKTAKEFERYKILLNKLEHTEMQASQAKEQISRMFKWSFA
jgi:hypothetical protein